MGEAKAKKDSRKRFEALTKALEKASKRALETARGIDEGNVGGKLG